MVAWKNDDELFALMRETLYSSVTAMEDSAHAGKYGGGRKGHDCA